MIVDCNWTFRSFATANNMDYKFVGAHMLADGLTKNVESRYQPFVMRTSVLHWVKHPDIERVYREEREREKLKRKRYSMENRIKTKSKKVDEATLEQDEIDESPEEQEWSGADVDDTTATKASKSSVPMSYVASGASAY